MPAAAQANSQPLTEATLKEIEIDALSGYHDTAIQDLQNDPLGFNNFKALKYLEFNARSLAEDYNNRVKKNLVPFNENLVNIAKRFANKRSSYEIIVQAEKHKYYLKNDRVFEMLVKTLKDCQSSAFTLATHRSKARENAVQEQLLSGNAVIQQNTVHIPRMQQQLDLLMGRMGLNQTQPAGGEQPHQAINIVQQNVPVENPPTYHANQQHPEQNANAPEWIISRQDCESLRSSSETKDSFVRAFSLKIFTGCEILQPLNEIPADKQNEAKNVVQHFYGLDGNWDAFFATTMKSLRTNKRHIIFNKIDKKGIGYGITNSGIVAFYYKSPLGNEMKCFSKEDCKHASRLETTTIGNCKVPRICGDFDYILLIEKSSRYGKFFKFFKDGRMMKLPK